MSSIIYGPVPSWRLGRSLGIDLLSTEGKTCSFDCIYCQLGKTVHPLSEPRKFISLDQLVTELEGIREVAADYATFSGMGEPTLASNLGEAIAAVKSTLHLPVAVLTNSSLMPREDVRWQLAQADVVVAKLDAPNEELFHLINNPLPNLHLEEIVEGIAHFRREYRTKLALQMMFVEVNKNYAAEMARIAGELPPDEVQLNTPLRPCAAEPLSRQEMDSIKQQFTGLNVVSVYDSSRPQVVPLNLEDTLRRRPEL
jgi:wyosine [tRNA(Phe)-imidazoG37] synthetase (radical SAM superfamily)